jgi:hypothetical protein
MWLEVTEKTISDHVIWRSDEKDFVNNFGEVVMEEVF